MELKDYIVSGQYEKLSDGEPRLIRLRGDFESFESMEPIKSEVYQEDQYEVDVQVFDSNDLKDHRDSIIATRSKKLLAALYNIWVERPKALVRVHCSGSGFRATYTVVEVDGKPKSGKKR